MAMTGTGPGPRYELGSWASTTNLDGDEADDGDDEDHRNRANPRSGLENIADQLASRERHRHQDEQQQSEPGHSASSGEDECKRRAYTRRFDPPTHAVAAASAAGGPDSRAMSVEVRALGPASRPAPQSTE